MVSEGHSFIIWNITFLKFTHCRSVGTTIDELFVCVFKWSHQFFVDYNWENWDLWVPDISIFEVLKRSEVERTRHLHSWRSSRYQFFRKTNQANILWGTLLSFIDRPPWRILVSRSTHSMYSGPPFPAFWHFSGTQYGSDGVPGAPDFQTAD